MRNLLHELAAAGATARIVARELTRSALRGLATLVADATRMPRPLRIGVDIRPFYEPLTGVGWYLHEILNRLAADDRVELIAFGDSHVSSAGPLLHAPLPPRTRYRIFDLARIRRGRWSEALARLAFPLLARLERVDLFFGGNYFLPRSLDAIAGKRVITVHDLTYRRRPDLLQEETLASLDEHMTRELARADAVICVSHATRNDLIAAYQIDPSRVEAILNGANLPQPQRFVVNRLDLPERYILFVSTIEPRKDLDTLLDAFESIRDRDRWNGHLVVAGRIGWKAEATAARLKSSRWAAVIHHLDYVPRNDLDEIYRRATLFVLPSLYEGFGFPVLEAMAHGVPVITSNVSSLPEVGGTAARYFEPGDARDLANTVESVLTDEAMREQMIRQGRDRIGAFDWDRAAAETLALFERVARS